MAGMDITRPRAIGPGETIGLVSTSSPVSAEELQRLTTYLEDRGHPVKVANGVLNHVGYLGGSIARRSAGVMEMFADREVALVLPVNGGTGAEHLVDRLDYNSIRANPTLFAGFSNPTSLNNAIWSATRIPTLHGVTGHTFSLPSVEPWTENAFWAMVTGSIAGQEISGPRWGVHRVEHPRVSGIVLGGNLSAFRTLVGTRWMPGPPGRSSCSRP